MVSDFLFWPAAALGKNRLEIPGDPYREFAMLIEPAYVSLDHRLFNLQRVRTADAWEFPEHGHRGFGELFLLIHGRLFHRCRGGEQELAPGSLVFIREDDRHALYGSRLDYVNLNIPAVELASLVPALERGLPGQGSLLDPARPPPQVRLAPPALGQFAHRVGLLAGIQHAPSAAIPGKRLLVDLFLALLEGAQPAPEESRPPWLDRLLTDGESPEHLTPALLARRAGVSAAHLSRSFRTFLGCTPSAWILRRRMEQVALALAHTTAPITAVAAAAGFRRPGWFYAAFRRVHGCTPAEYRQQHGIRR